jgi:ubiquinone/menaquinone biosynthesis C-methylase UbiE
MISSSLTFPALKTYSLARSGLYFAESIPLTLLSAVLVGRGRENLDQQKLRDLWHHLNELHEADIHNIECGFYSARVLAPTKPLEHIKSLARLWWDATRVGWRMKTRKHKDFHGISEELLEDLPEYYQRNFHFQTDGYLSEASAELYDHQVDVLFSGAAGAMRRLVIPPLRSHIKKLDRSHILELGCGPASATVYLANAFPKSKITGIDLSAPYVKVAQTKLRKIARADVMQADASNLPFKNNSFDAVTSTFMFHELPEEVRIEILQEARRVLKPGGILVIADSIQMNDNPSFNWALDRFPLNYHEPFYANYVRTPLKGLFEIAGFPQTNESHKFLTKVVWAIKSSDFKRSKVVSI